MLFDMGFSNTFFAIIFSGMGKKSKNKQMRLSQFSSVQSLSRVRLCDTMNRSTPGLLVHHQLPEFTQTHVHRVSDAIQPSHPLSCPSSPALNPSQHQSLFQWVNSSHEVAKVLEFQLQHYLVFSKSFIAFWCNLSVGHWSDVSSRTEGQGVMVSGHLCWFPLGVRSPFWGPEVQAWEVCDPSSEGGRRMQWLCLLLLWLV